MPNAKVEAILKQFELGIIQTTTDFFKRNKKDALASVQQFWNDSKADVERWTLMWNEGQLTVEEFQFLVQSKKDSAEMQAFLIEGVSQIRLNKFKRNLIQTMVKVAFAVLI